jgi:hypothetical protein
MWENMHKKFIQWRMNAGAVCLQAARYCAVMHEKISIVHWLSLSLIAMHFLCSYTRHLFLCSPFDQLKSDLYFVEFYDPTLDVLFNI